MSTEHEQLNGWRCPDGSFIPADETPAVRMDGLELGGHAKAAIEHLASRKPILSMQLYAERNEAGFETWEECEPLIKNFMTRHGYVRVAPE